MMRHLQSEVSLLERLIRIQSIEELVYKRKDVTVTFDGCSPKATFS